MKMLRVGLGVSRVVRVQNDKMGACDLEVRGRRTRAGDESEPIAPPPVIRGRC